MDLFFSLPSFVIVILMFVFLSILQNMRRSYRAEHDESRRIQNEMLKSLRNIEKLLAKESPEQTEPQEEKIAPVQEEEIPLPPVLPEKRFAGEETIAGPAPEKIPVAGEEEPILPLKEEPFPEPELRTDTPERNTVEEIEPENIDARTSKTWNRIIQWFCVGENYRYKNISGEYAFATTWLIRIGVIILIAGIVFFLKYAIQNNLISPEVRIGGAFLAGCAMAMAGIFGANKKYHIAAVGIMGAGFVTMYLSARAGYIIYSMTDSLTAYAIMTVITVAAMASAIKVNHQLPAFLGIAGGYLTPIMLSAESRNITGFFIYLTIISFGILILANFRKWRGVNLFGFLLFTFLTIAALSGGLTGKTIHTGNCRDLIFLLGANYAVFTFVPVCYQLRKRLLITRIEVSVQLLNHLLFTIGGLIVLGTVFHAPACETPQIILLLATVIFQLGLLLLYFLRRVQDKNVIYAAASLTVYSSAMIMPVWLSGEWITASWAFLAMVMILIAVSIRSTYLYKNALIIFVISFLRIILCDAGKFDPYAVSFKPSFLSFGVFTIALIVSWVATAVHMRRVPEDIPALKGPRTLFAVTGSIGFFLYTSLEIYKFLHLRIPEFTRGGLSLWWGIIAVGLLFTGILHSRKNSRILGLVLFGICTLKVFFYDLAGYSLLAKSIGLLILSAIMIGGAVLYIRFKDQFNLKDEADS